MDELPREARDLLRLASDAHDPPSAEARARVRRGVAMAVATGVGATVASHAVAQGSVKAGLFSGLAGKLAGAGLAVAVVGTLAVTAPTLKQDSRATSSAVASKRHAQAPKHVEAAPFVAPAVPAAAAEPVAAEPVVEAVEREPAAQVAPAIVPTIREHAPTHQTRRHRAHHAPVAAQSLATVEPAGLSAEMALLKRASQALAQNDARGAEQALAEHTRQFPSSALREERDGLTVLAHCMASPARARSEGARFMKRAPQSVLAQRVARACKLEGEP